MNGWSSHSGADRWDDEPAWVYEITWEWEPQPGQRYPGDPGRRQAVHHPVYDASRAAEAASAWDADFRQIAQASGPPAPSSGGPSAARPVSPAAGRATVGRPPQPPPSWSGPDEQGYAPPGPRTPYVAGTSREAQARSTPPPPQGPSWNRAVPLPDRLPDAERRHQRPSADRPASAPPLYGESSRTQPARPETYGTDQGGRPGATSYSTSRSAPQDARSPEQQQPDPRFPEGRHQPGQQPAEGRFAADTRFPDGRYPGPEQRVGGQRPEQRTAHRSVPETPQPRSGGDSYVPYRLGPASQSPAPARAVPEPSSRFGAESSSAASAAASAAQQQPARPVGHETPPYQRPAATTPVAPYPAPRPVPPDPAWAPPVDPRPATPLG